MRKHDGVFCFFDDVKRGEQKMSKRSLVAIVMMLCMSFGLLVGCSGDGGASVADNTEVSSVVEDVNSEVSVSEEASETGSEETTEIEEISEIVSEESGEEFYSAQEVITFTYKLIAAYQYNDSEHIKALVIAANLDYITAEELDIILDTFGYTLEDLSALYDEYVMDHYASICETIAYVSGVEYSISPDREYKRRITLADAMLNENDKQFATSFDEVSYLFAYNDAESAEYILLENLSNSEYSTSGEQTVVNFAYALSNGEVMGNPYSTYQDTIE